ncbi:MAG: ribosome recycling factor [Holosporales bacterium]|jgi:ribosome recycling factor|nr:ribosome recycling factor [Holosporales bacterium]
MSDGDLDKSLADFDAKMQNSVAILVREFSGIRASRASSGLLDTVRVEMYGSLVPIQQVGTISAPEARMLVVQVWDKSLVKQVEKAIRESDLGLNPAIDGQLIRIPMPTLSEERRQELSKVAARLAEETKIAVRNVRRDAMELLKKKEKAHEITEDDLHRLSDTVQKITDSRIGEIEDILEKKQKDIMAV